MKQTKREWASSGPMSEQVVVDMVLPVDQHGDVNLEAWNTAVETKAVKKETIAGRLCVKVKQWREYIREERLRKTATMKSKKRRLEEAEAQDRMENFDAEGRTDHADRFL